MIQKLLSSVNFRGKGRLVNMARSLFLPRDHTIKMKNFPNSNLRFSLNYLWADEASKMLWGCPDHLRGDLLFLKSQGPFNGNILDIGANMGLYSLYFSSELLKSNYKVYAFEPIQAIFERCHENILLNKAQDKIKLESFAVHNFTGLAEIQLRRDIFNESGISSFEPIDFPPGQTTVSVTVPVITIDDYCDKNSINNVKLIKIDVEGNEINVLEGAKKTIKMDSPAILFEVNKANFNGDYKSALKIYGKFFEHFNYDIYYQEQLEKKPIKEAFSLNMVKDGTCGNWWAVKQS